MTTFSHLSSQQLRRIADLKEQIESLETQLSSLTGETPAPVEQASPSGKRVMSAAAKARIAAAQRARWAKVRAAKGEPSESTTVPKKSRSMSAAAKAKIAAIARARWAKAKAAGKSTL